MLQSKLAPSSAKEEKRFKETACATAVLDIHVSCDGDNKRKHQNKTKKGKKKLSFGHLTLIKISREDKLRHLKNKNLQEHYLIYLEKLVCHR